MPAQFLVKWHGISRSVDIQPLYPFCGGEGLQSLHHRRTDAPPLVLGQDRDQPNNADASLRVCHIQTNGSDRRAIKAEKQGKVPFPVLVRMGWIVILLTAQFEENMAANGVVCLPAVDVVSFQQPQFHPVAPIP